MLTFEDRRLIRQLRDERVRLLVEDDANVCANCGDLFEPTGPRYRDSQRYCSKRCRHAAAYQAKRKRRSVAA